MLKELLDGLVELADKARRAKVHRIEGMPTTVFIETNDGKIDERELPPLPRKHQVSTLFDLIKLAKEPAAKKPVIWHNEKCVTLLLDDDDRREEARLALELSPQYVALRTLGDKVAANNHAGFQPKELVNFFRRNLAGTIYDRSIVSSLRKIKFKTTSEERNDLGRGRESIGRDVEAELQTDIELPEEFTIEVPVYQTPYEDEMFAVRCLLDVDAIERRIFFLPEPGALELARQAKQKDIREQLEQELAGTQVGIFQGTP